MTVSGRVSDFPAIHLALVSAGRVMLEQRSYPSLQAIAYIDSQRSGR